MSFDPAAAVDRQFLEFVRAAPAPGPPADLGLPVRPGSSLNGATLLELLDSQMVCRHLDLEARALRARGQGFYTIGSAGHEGNVVLGDLLRDTDPCFLHYRSGALMAQRFKKRPHLDFVRDTLLGVVASSEDPISGGRHKVWGSRDLWVPPQTSTIASHFPKAVGAALAIDRAARMGLRLEIPEDSVVACSFGDASVNHSTAQGALNAAGWLGYQQIPAPLLFVCEDNGTGISVATPAGWIENSVGRRAGIFFFSTDGCDIQETYDTARRAVDYCRSRRQPVFLQLKVVRLMGHAGSDVEQVYRSHQEIVANHGRDPVLHTARMALAMNLLTPAELEARYEAIRIRIQEVAAEVVDRPRLTSVAEIASPVAPHDEGRLEAERSRAAAAAQDLATPEKDLPLAALINQGLREALHAYPESLIFGEDVARKGGVYNVTAGLWKEFGPGRVFNTILDEQSILGLASGAAHLGFLPIPEIQYLAYLHNAEDQLRGEACSLQFFSRDQFRNPMVVRIASYGYQKGFGGHFHNDNSLGALRDVPGLILASPSRGDDAVRVLRSCLAMARANGRVVAFLEPIALYHVRDLYEEGDGGWLGRFPPPGETLAPGEGRAHGPEEADLTLVSYANGLYRSLRAARTLERDHGLRTRVLDLVWLNPLNHDWVADEARRTGRVLVVDECRRSGGLGEALLAGLAERSAGEVRMGLLAGADTYIPLGPAMDLCLPSEEDIVARALQLTD